MKTTLLLWVAAGIFYGTSLSALAQTAAKPTFSPNGKDFIGSVSVQITSATTGSTIFYTTNGTTPTTRSPSITNGGSVNLNSSAIIKAIARRPGYAGSALAASKGYYHYSISATNQHNFYGDWPDPLFDTKMNAIRDNPSYRGTQHFNFFGNTTIETKGARRGFRVLSNWKFHGNGATLKLSTNTPREGGLIDAYVIGVASRGTSAKDEVDNVLIEGFDINCNDDQLSRFGTNAMVRGVLLIGSHNEVRNCTVRQPRGWHPAGRKYSEIFAIDLRAAHKNSSNNLVHGCVVTDYRGGEYSWVNGIAMSSASGVTLSGKVENCKVYGKGSGNDYGYNAQGPVSVVFDGNESHNMNRGFNNDTGDGYNIKWVNSVFRVPAKGKGMHIIASKDGYAAFNKFYLDGVGATAIALAGPVGPQPGARNWIFEANRIERTGNYSNCRGIVFGPFPWDQTKPPPSDIAFYDNRIDLNIANLVLGGTNCVFRGNRGLIGPINPAGRLD